MVSRQLIFGQITNAEPAFPSPHVQATGSVAESSGQQETLLGEVLDIGDNSSLQAATPAQSIAKPGPFSAHISGPSAKGRYEFGAVIHHPCRRSTVRRSPWSVRLHAPGMRVPLHDPQVSKARPGPPTHGFGFMEVALTQALKSPPKRNQMINRG